MLPDDKIRTFNEQFEHAKKQFDSLVQLEVYRYAKHAGGLSASTLLYWY